MIAIDWGTSSLRAYRLGEAGDLLAERSAATGLLSVAADHGGDFEGVLARLLDGWGDPTVLMAGMVGSRNGWREVPYLPCPAGAAEIAAGLCPIDAPRLAGRRVAIAPGLSFQPPDGAPPEVMRGEETQVLGLLDALPGPGPHTVCLPGTHSKWVQVHGGRITALRTAMTGELYALLRRHSLLAALMPTLMPTQGAAAADDTDDLDAFARGVAASAAHAGDGARDGAGQGGLLNQLFGVRALGLFGRLDAAAAPSYLSGLLIGHELNELLPPGAACVHLVGAAALVARYERALALRGVAVQRHAATLAARGLYRLAQARDLPR